MIKSDVEYLKTKIDNGNVKIHCIDGEEVTVNILSVSETEEDIVCDIISSNHRDQDTIKKGAYLIKFSEIKGIDK